MKIFEGMWAGDLEDLVQPLVSVDEYESKIDNTAIAIGFYVNDRDAADDLNRFIQKSSVPILDSDVSPAPDAKGYYIVFAELQMNDRFAKNLMELCGEVGSLSGVDNWQAKVRGTPQAIKLDSDKITKMMLRNRMSDRMSELQASLKEVKSKLTSSEKSPHR